MPEAKVQIPGNWAKTEITKFQQLMYQNQHATFANHALVSQIDTAEQCYSIFADGLVDPRPFLPMVLFTRAYGLFLSAAALAMAADTYSTVPVLRGSLECAAYAHYIRDDAHKADVWKRRNESDTANKRMRRLFAQGKVRGDLLLVYRDLGEQYHKLYERLIETGGHPNGIGVMSLVEWLPTDDGAQMQTVFLGNHNGLLGSTLGAVVDTAIANLYMMRLVYPARFEMLELTEKLNSLAQQRDQTRATHE